MRHRLQTTNLFLLAMMGMYFAASTIVSVVIALFPDMPYAAAWMNLTLYLIGFGLPCLIYAVLLRYRLSNQPISTTFSFHKIKAPTILLCILLGILIQPMASLIAQIASLIFTDITSSSIVSMTSMPLALMIFSTALLPAVFEEMLCRGVLYDGCKDAPLWYQLLVPGCFFGLLHMNFQQISYALPMGIFLAAVLYITDSIYATMIIHFVMNGTQVTLSWMHETLGWFNGTSALQDAVGTFFCGSENLWITAAIGIGALLAIVGVLVILGKIHHVSEKPRRMVYPGWHSGSWIMYMICGFLFLCAVIMEFAMPLLEGLM